MSHKSTRKAKVKQTGEEIEVYKLDNPQPANKKWNRYLGDKISMTAIEQQKHTETYSDDELQFLN